MCLLELRPTAARGFRGDSARLFISGQENTEAKAGVPGVWEDVVAVR